MRRLGVWPAAFALLGLALFTGTIAWLGWDGIMRALERVSIGGFAIYFGVQLVIMAGLAGAWRLLLRHRRGGRFALLYWGRLVRDAAGEFLPFSHVGGFILGGRAIALGGVTFADAAASTLADVTVEFLAELVFIAVGLVLLVGLAPKSTLLVPVTLGLVVAMFGAAGFLFVQKGGARVFRGLAMRIAGRSAESASIRMERLQAALDAIYARPARMLGAGALHLVCWFGTGVASYVAFHALGADISLTDALAIEALLHAILAAGFFVPGRIGVQEAAYTLLGSVFGIPPDIALSVSLLRRARDLIIAVPVLLVWQGIEARRLQPVSSDLG
ncbi:MULTISPECIES: flippase-like domain-containing protein [Acidiphilium]|uniref:Flippase-like domain-containing protein n=1 Tax=Acidiphilium iwatense TaxID=768198 RepID=A0ABS9DV95_9PROT|nr:MULTISPECIES: flippase-like domain-containing protein [Acidiphilium]MCF3945387.1 flippase-like domain-containing protein [Acidiphilium iwatense]